MLKQYLKESIEDIKKLISITNNDIKDIKEANKENLFKSVEEKNNLITSFNEKKSLLDGELAKLADAKKGEDFSQFLSADESDMFEQMKELLQELQISNKKYAKLVVIVGEFYNSLLENMFPSEENGYSKPTSKPASFLKVRV